MDALYLIQLSMYYSLPSIIALIVLSVINFDLLFNKEYRARNSKALNAYRFFLLFTLIYCITDILWGALDPLPNKLFVTIDTALYFIAMALLIWAWTNFITKFIADLKISKIIIRIAGFVFLISGIAVVIINFFTPILFTYQENVYAPRIARYIYLGSQVTAYLLTSIYAFIGLFRTKGYRKEQLLTLGTYGLIMFLFISLQMYYPLYPFYAIGCLIGNVLIHTFIVVSTKVEISQELAESKDREKKQAKEIETTKELAYLDPLTGVKNKHAYVELEINMDHLIHDKEIGDFSFFIFDLNDLKLINDTYGHDMGDRYIIKSVELIKKFFPGNEIYRFGGDEFVVILTGKDFEKRFDYLEKFNAHIEKSKNSTDPIVAVGFSDFVKEKDNTLRSVFLRADERMYSRKKTLKSMFNKASEEAGNKSLGAASLMEVRYELYRMFYYSSNVSLLDMLNSSSCDEIVEIDTNADTFKQIYHVDGKYFVPSVEFSYKDLLDFTEKHIIHPDDLGVYLGLMKFDGFFERLKNARIPGFDFAHFRYKCQDGSYRWVEQVVVAGEEYGLHKGIFRLYVFDINNIKSRQLGTISDESITFSALRDQVTGLLSSKEFFAKSEDILSKNRSEQWCLVAIDVEHFRLFDEWFGREKGNLLLAKIGAKLNDYMEKVGGSAGYFGQDDFLIFCRYDMDFLNELFNSLHETISSFGLTAGFLPAMGVALIEDNTMVVDAFDRATIAITRAKKDMKNRIAVFDPQMQSLVIQEYKILTDFMSALKNETITFHLQPQCVISSGQFVGAEALARWPKGDGTYVSPGTFIPVLEKYGFVTDLDKYIWEKVCQWIRKRLDENKREKLVPISLNVSQIDILHIDVAKHFAELCDKYNIPRKYIKVEITESAYAELSTMVDELVHKLRASGFVVLMDDFGSGYSSLNMLSSLKIDAIKLDAKFLQIGGSEYQKGIHIIESVINMAKTMALPIIVEGAETKEQIDFLKQLGVVYIQGYYFYKPMPVEEFEKLISDPKIIDKGGIVSNRNEQFRIREFLDANIYSDSMLNNIIGAVAIYSVNKGHVDIVRFNQIFRDSVNVPEFADRLNNIEQFLPEKEVDSFFKAFKEAKENRLNGATGVFKFLRTDGLYSSFKMHFYYIGKKEGTDRFYGSATNVSELNDLNENKELITKYSTDNMIFVSRVNDSWKYTVISHSLSDIIGLTPSELEVELNNGLFAKRVVNAKDLMKLMDEGLKAHLNHQKSEFTTVLIENTNKKTKAKLELSIRYVADESTNVVYLVRTKLLEQE